MAALRVDSFSRKEIASPVNNFRVVKTWLARLAMWMLGMLAAGFAPSIASMYFRVTCVRSQACECL